MRIGVDVGGTKIEVIAIEPGGKEILRERVPTPHDDYKATVRAIRDLVTSTEHKLGEQGSVGIGIPGTINKATGLVKNSNSEWLIGHPFEQDVARSLSRDVRMTNDANCFTVSESRDGAGSGFDVVFGVIIGTGVGGGICVGGRALNGANGIAGEWGHNPLPWPTLEEVAKAPTCYCGKKGCIESWCSGPALSTQYQHATGEKLQATEIATAAKNGDAVAAELVENYSSRFARALAHIVNILDPDVIVLGGGLSKMDFIYAEVPARVKMQAFNPDRIPLMRENIHGDSSGVRGAAWLWDENETKKANNS